MEDSGGQKGEEEVSGFSSAGGVGAFRRGAGFPAPRGVESY